LAAKSSDHLSITGIASIGRDVRGRGLCHWRYRLIASPAPGNRAGHRFAVPVTATGPGEKPDLHVECREKPHGFQQAVSPAANIFATTVASRNSSPVRRLGLRALIAAQQPIGD
jgi:hypothetical protein